MVEQQGIGDGALDRYWAAMKQAYSQVYSEVAADHMVYPRNAAELQNHSCFGIVNDRYDETISIWLEIKDNCVSDASFTCDECHTCTASASVVTEMARNKTPQEALGITTQNVLDELHGLPEEDHHCAELAVCTLHAAINDYLSNLTGS